jgi:hypothetical protein
METIKFILNLILINISKKNNLMKLVDKNSIQKNITYLIMQDSINK